MGKVIDWVLKLKPASEISLGAGMLVLLCFIYVGCQEGFSLLTLIGVIIGLFVMAVVTAFVIFAILMILDGLFSLGE